MTLNNKELRAIERAIGMVVAVADTLDGPRADTLCYVVAQIDEVLSQAEKREEASRLTYQEALERSLRPTDYTGTTSVHNLHNTLGGANEVGV